MNREIKFRMKDKQGEWQYVEMVCSIIEALKDPVTPGGIDIDEKTIGQYTVIDDKNGKEIYEGDIVLLDCYYYEEPAFDGEFKVIYDDINGMWFLVDLENKDRGFAFGEIRSYYKAEIEVIGNIYDNPELLGGE